MASLPIFSFVPSKTRIYATAAAKGAGGGKEEKGLFDWILGNLQKEEQFYETDPILKKVVIVGCQMTKDKDVCHTTWHVDIGFSTNLASSIPRDQQRVAQTYSPAVGIDYLP
ncbi:hypothetical protein GOBAR_AA38363 [Gossypium barbadense]|uniref:Uncharacterized protein n=1 Tax=Gossypium barbadense TaxID=3634 RepID=A0A2P5VU31_GOSBA|nr:hypothetical protein GOBAR_AA38363 [Gossypium barbadense]